MSCIRCTNTPTHVCHMSLSFSTKYGFDPKLLSICVWFRGRGLRAGPCVPADAVWEPAHTLDVSPTYFRSKLTHTQIHTYALTSQPQTDQTSGCRAELRNKTSHRDVSQHFGPMLTADFHVGAVAVAWWKAPIKSSANICVIISRNWSEHEMMAEPWMTPLTDTLASFTPRTTLCKCLALEWHSAPHPPTTPPSAAGPAAGPCRISRTEKRHRRKDQVCSVLMVLD